MVSVLANRRLSESAGAQLFFLPGEFETLTVVAGAVVRVEIPPLLRDFQAQWESPAVGLFHEAAFSTARLPTNSAKDPFFFMCPPLPTIRSECTVFFGPVTMQMMDTVFDP